MSFAGRDDYQLDVENFLQKLFPQQSLEISWPASGTGSVTYYASNHDQAYFIKLGANVERYQLMSELGLVPEVIASGELQDGTTILVQPRLQGKHPTGADFARHLLQFAAAVRKMHGSQRLLDILPQRTSLAYRDVGLAALADVKQRWQQHKTNVLHLSAFVDAKIAYLEAMVSQFSGQGLVASHGDICNANWMVSDTGRIYLLDLDSMAQDDPALDLGALLWWYYPPELRPEFLAAAGYQPSTPELQLRLRLRMAIHSLHILLPRQGSLDRFSTSRFESGLADFKAVVEGRENPQGYWV